MTTQANLYIDRGIDFNINLDIVIEGEEITSLDTRDFFCNIRKIYSSTPSANATVTPVTSSNTSIIELSVPATESIKLSPGKHSYDVVMVNPSGLKTKLVEGLVVIIPTITEV